MTAMSDEAPARPYVYFVSYACARGFGQMDVGTSAPLRSGDLDGTRRSHRGGKPDHRARLDPLLPSLRRPTGSVTPMSSAERWHDTADVIGLVGVFLFIAWAFTRTNWLGIAAGALFAVALTVGITARLTARTDA